MVLFDLNGTLTDPSPIGGAWGSPALGAEVLALAVQTAMVDAILGISRSFSHHVESALRDKVRERGFDPAPIEQALEVARALPAFPDTAPALDVLAGAGRRLAVLTNSGAQDGRGTLEANGLAERFARILGVDAVGSFKPHPATYRYALDELGCDAAEVTYVSAHGWDLSGAAHAGMRTALVLRRGRPPTAYRQPDTEGADLAAVAAALA